ncbi:MAG: IS30 family transposase [Candidatus Gracilibacteria bacterium]|nr:IS30 family transposase [Candidatus Gracilibacteria bacterium]
MNVLHTYYRFGKYFNRNISKRMIKLFKRIPKYKRLTITYDNGKEFSEASRITYFTGLDIYFAHPYASWERGTNENTNGLLRQFLPKKTDFQSVSENQLKFYVSLINFRPRKRLNYLSPNEVFFNIPKSRISV